MKPLDRRTLGRTGLQVSVLGMGAADIGFKHASGITVTRLLRSALDAGVNVIDTAECYADSEEKLGRAIPSRHDVHLFTKCGHRSGFELPDWSPQLLEKSIERSLRRLRTDYLDLVQLHGCSESVLRQGDVVDVLQKAKAAGKSRYIGYSGDGQHALCAVQSGAFDTLQVSVSLADQQSIDVILPAAKARNMGVIVKRPLARVAWTLRNRIGKTTRDVLRAIPLFRRRWEGVLNDAYADRFDALDYGFLKRGGREAVAMALRFVVGVEGVHTALIGTIKPRRWPQNAAIVAEGPLDRTLVESIRARWRAVASQDWTQH